MRNVKSVCLTVACALGLFGTAASSAHAVTFSGSSGSLAASAAFTVNGAGNLVVTLTNTSTADVLVPANVLTAVFFDLGGTTTLSRISGTLSGASTVFYDPDGQPAGGVVGGEWAYKAGLATPYTATEGISSAGLGLFGPADRFPGANLAGPLDPDGLQYGLLSAGDNTATGNPGGILGSGGLIKNAVTFVLSCSPLCTSSTLNQIANVVFQYGTALTEPHFGAVPLPPALVLFGTALVGMGVLSRRRRTKHAAVQ
jgi:hypothetical protein